MCHQVLKLKPKPKLIEKEISREYFEINLKVFHLFLEQIYSCEIIEWLTWGNLILLQNLITSLNGVGYTFKLLSSYFLMIDTSTQKDPAPVTQKYDIQIKNFQKFVKCSFFCAEFESAIRFPKIGLNHPLQVTKFQKTMN